MLNKKIRYRFSRRLVLNSGVNVFTDLDQFEPVAESCDTNLFQIFMLHFSQDIDSYLQVIL